MTTETVQLNSPTLCPNIVIIWSQNTIECTFSPFVLLPNSTYMCRYNSIWLYNVYIRNSFNIEMFNSLCEPGTNFVVRRHCRTKFFTIWLRKIVVRIKYDFCICRSSQNCSQKENIANFLNKTRETILTIFFIFHLQN